MNRKNKISLVIAFLLVVMIGGGFFYQFKSAHRNIAEEETVANFEAPELIYEFMQSESRSQNYIDQVIKVSGSVTSVEQKTIVLNNMVQVDLVPSTEPIFKKGDLITVKGRCVGYDDLLEVVKIDQATYISE